MDATEQLDINFLEAETNDCPYAAYEKLREHAPVWKDPATGMYLVTRNEDVRTVLTDTQRFSSEVGSAATRREAVLKPSEDAGSSARQHRASLVSEIRSQYEQSGWFPAPNMAALDDPSHADRRSLFENYFRPAQIEKYEGFMSGVLEELYSSIEPGKSLDFVSTVSVPFPLAVIGEMVGVPSEDLEDIKRWTADYVARMNLEMPHEELMRSVRSEIEMQHYFQAHFDRLRERPDSTFLSHLVNSPLPEAGRCLTDEELHGEMMSDLFVGGAETTTNALSHGVRYLATDPELWANLKHGDERLVSRFAEEVLRLQSPVQSLLRKCVQESEIAGTVIPAGAIVNVRYASANRDPDAYSQPAEMDLARQRPRQHVAFGVGAHHCLGAALARSELQLAFKHLIERFDGASLVDPSDYRHAPNYFLRSLLRLEITFE